MSVVIETTVGDITVDLYLKERPNTCLNFLKLCKIKYYNLCLFYKIEKNFIAQSGDPTATGRGGESIFCHLYGDQAKYFDAEFKPRLKHKKVGTLSMVNNGNNMNGSQFFITLSENLTYLDEDHTVFGEVAEGFDVLLKLNDAICDNNNRPYQDIRITHTVVLHDPFEDPKGLEVPDASPEPTKEMLESNYIGADEEIDDNKGKTTEEIEEKIKESEAKARATILEMVGDIPDAEVKPPENVLFVCKLNPVTTSEDLEMIFSRFGKIMSCEVIKDKKTGESLQYAFIEFEKEENCEAAYFKMDNVLIDDRRIHVDFSQSVSKLNFDKDGKYKSHNSKPAKSSISLKKTERSDGYELIFDMEDNASVSDGRRKGKSRASENETSSKKHKHSSQSENKDYREKREHYERRYTDNKNDKYLHEKYKSSKYKEQDYNQTKSDKYGREKDKSSKYREYDYKNTKSNKYEHDINKSSKYRESDYKDTNDKHWYEKDSSSKYRENKYSHLIDKGKDSDQYLKSKNKHTSGKSYKDSESYKKSSDEYKKSRKSQYDSMSPDRPRKSYGQYKEHSPSNSHSSKGKYSDNVDHYEYSTKGIKRKSSKSNEKNVPSKKKMSKRSSSSSSSSDSDSSSSSSSSTSDYKSKGKSHHQKQKFSKSSSRPKNQKKRKYST